jgi:acyl-CoA thioesterase-1
METKFITEERYSNAILEITDKINCVSGSKPVKFQNVMWSNRGETAQFSAFPATDDGLERKNPLIVAIGDSVTAGHFEFVLNADEMRQKMETRSLSEDDDLEVVDVQKCYLDIFRKKLIEKYRRTSLSVINSGIAGDTILGIEKRLDRDAIRYQPDMILINASLNWMPESGDNKEYYRALKAVATRVKNETKADIVLLTPNISLPTPFDNPLSNLEDRVDIIRTLAEELQVTLVDVYKIWKEYISKGYPAEKLLANGVNHPSIVGHEVYARALMKMFD